MPDRRQFRTMSVLLAVALAVASAAVTWHVQPSWLRGAMLKSGVFWAFAHALHSRVPWEHYAPDLQDPERRHAVVFILTNVEVPEALAPGLMQVVDDDPVSTTSRLAVDALVQTGWRNRPTWIEPLGVDRFMARVAVEAPPGGPAFSARRGAWIYAHQTPSVFGPRALAYLHAKASSGTSEQKARARELLHAIEQPKLPDLESSPPAPSAAEGQDGMTTIHLPGRPDMTPEQCAAWWAGVPVERLRLMGPDRAFMPPELAPPDGIVRRTWRVTPEDGAPSANAQTCLVHVYLPSGWVSAAPIGPLRAATGRPITEADAEGLAGEFMASRGFSPDSLGSPRVRKQGDDGKGRTTLVVVEFAGVLSGEGSAQVTVDLVAGVVGAAALSLPGPAPSSRPRKPDLSLKQASSALESELVSRGMGDYELQSGREWHPPYEATLDAPYYLFVVDRRYTRPGAAVPMLLREHWYVNGITGTVHREDELPALKEMMEATYRAGEERNRAATASDPSAPPPAPTP